MKKYSKTFATMLVVLGVSATGVSAKEIPLNKVTDLVNTFNAEKERKNNNIFIVGNDIITSYETLTFQNIYFAGLHGFVGFTKPDDVYVYEVEYTPDASFETGTWSVKPVTIVGDHAYKTDDKFDIKFIDFEPVESRDTMSTDTYIKGILDLIKNSENYEISLDQNSDTITALYHDDVESASFETIFDDEFVEKLYEFLKKDIYGTTITLEPITEDASAQPVSIKLDDLTASDSLALDEDKVADLVDKLSTFGDALKTDHDEKALNAQFKVSVSYDDENYANTDRKENGEEPTYIVTIKQQVNVKDYFKEDGLDFIVKGNVATYNIQNTTDWENTTKGEIKKIAKIFENAFEGKTASIEFTFGKSHESYSLGTDETTLEGYFEQYLGTNGIEDYDDLKDIQISVTFKLLDGAVSENGKNAETFTIKLDSYINTDLLIDKIVKGFNDGNTEYSTYTAERKGSEIIITLNSANNALGNLGAAATTLSTQLQTVLVQDAKVKSVKFDDNQVSSNYLNVLRAALTKGTEKETLGALNVGELAKAKEIQIELELTPGNVSQNHEKTETYTLKFVVEGINVDTMLSGITDESGKYYVSSYDAEKKELTINLKSVDTLVKDVSGTGIITKLGQYMNVIKTISVNGTDLTESKDIKGDLIEILSTGKADATLEDLTKLKEPLTLDITLIDEVNPSKLDKTTEVKVIFTSDAIKKATHEEGSTLQELIQAGVEKIYLEEDQEVTGLQTIKNTNNLTIIGGGHTIKGDFTVNSPSSVVTLQDLTIDGNLNLWNEANIENVTVTGKVTTDKAGEILNKVTIENGLDVKIGGKNIVINNSTISGEVSLAGDGAKVTDTDITGHVQIAGANVSISGGSIAGVRSEAQKDANFAVIEVTGDEFTLDGATVSFDTAKTTKYAYSLVRTNKAEGIKSTIQGNTFNIANVKNPVELFGTTKDGTIITKNQFIGNNAEINLTDDTTSKARNIISIYGVDKEDAKISITNNKFDYANWAVRITNNNDHKVLYNINNNTVDNQIVDEQVAFVGIEKDSAANGDLNKITIVAPATQGANTIKGVAFRDMADKRSNDDSTLTNRLVYVYDSTNSEVSPLVVND